MDAEQRSVFQGIVYYYRENMVNCRYQVTLKDAVDGALLQQALDAALELRLEQSRRADCTYGPAHRCAHPVRFLNPQLVKEVGRDARVERQAVLVLRRARPLTQAPSQCVGADHAVARCQVGGQRVHVAAGARQPVPRDHHRGIRRAPLHVVDFIASAGGVAR